MAVQIASVRMLGGMGPLLAKSVGSLNQALAHCIRVLSLAHAEVLSTPMAALNPITALTPMATLNPMTALTPMATLTPVAVLTHPHD